MKIKLLLIVTCLIWQVKDSKAQTAGQSPLQISWQPLLNNYDGKEQALSELIIRNVSDKPFPWQGWKLYFNFIRLAEPVDNHQSLDVHHINGDYFYFEPNVKGKVLAPGEEVKYTMISKSWVVNFNDAPQGFYLDWGNGQLQQLPAVKALLPKDEKVFYRVGGDREMNAQMIYDKNERYQWTKRLDGVNILPTPVSVQPGKGSYDLGKSVTISYEPHFEGEATLLAEELGNIFGLSCRIASSTSASKQGIQLVEDKSLEDEAYKLSVAKSGVKLSASSGAGMFYAIQSLKLLVDPTCYDPKNTKGITLPFVQISDKPRFGSRSLMLDVARNFQTKEQIYKMLDMMALYKLNTLHFHLNDDEGWRLEIPSIPELTEVGSRRGHWEAGKENDWLPPSYGSGPFLDNPRASGYYTAQDFMDILKYAQRRHIQVIPEVETPGHARAAIQAMNVRYRRLMAQGKEQEASKYLLQSAGDSSVYRSVQKWNDNVMDVSLPSVYIFLEQVTDDIIGMYKQAGVELKTVHFGGDEVPNGVWEHSPAFANFKKENPAIKETADLWVRHFDILYKMLKKRDLLLSGWEEVGMEKVIADGKKKWIPFAGLQDSDVHLNVWNNLGGNEDLAYRLANAGYKVKLSFVSNFYMDMAYYKRFSEQGFYWGGFIDLEKPFSFIPFDYLHNQKQDWLGRTLPDRVLNGAEKLTEKGKQHIVGIQALLWSETIKDEEQMERMIFPRLLAFSERAWAQAGPWETETVSNGPSYQDALKKFFAVVGLQELQRLPFLYGGISFRIPTPGVKEIDGKIYVNMELPGFEVRYAADGNTPDRNSTLYTGAIPYKSNLVFKAFNKHGDSSLPISLDVESAK